MNLRKASQTRKTRISRVQADALFKRADQYWDKGELKKAFRLFLSAAKAGDGSSQLNVGYFYDQGIGVRPNRSFALYWFKRAYRRGDAYASTNIGTIWRDQHKLGRALYWFQRAVDLGDQDANLQIAKIYLRDERHRAEAIPYLHLVCKSNHVTEATAEEAKRLLKTLSKYRNN